MGSAPEKWNGYFLHKAFQDGALLFVLLNFNIFHNGFIIFGISSLYFVFIIPVTIFDAFEQVHKNKWQESKVMELLNMYHFMPYPGWTFEKLLLADIIQINGSADDHCNFFTTKFPGRYAGQNGILFYKTNHR